MLDKNLIPVDAFQLSHSVEIYVPSTVNVNESVDSSNYVNVVASGLSQINGGATIKSAEGCWYSDALKTVVRESITIIESSCAALDAGNVARFFELAKWIKSEMSQEAVSIKIDGELFLV